MTPLVGWSIAHQLWRLAAILFVVAAISDALDGWLARVLSARTSLGELLDPLADKALINATAVGCAAAGLLPWWLAAMIAARDLVILGGAALTRSLKLGQSLLPLMIGKASTAIQMVLLATVMINAVWRPVPQAAVHLLAMATVALTCASGLAYALHWLRPLCSGRMAHHDHR